MDTEPKVKKEQILIYLAEHLSNTNISDMNEFELSIAQDLCEIGYLKKCERNRDEIAKGEERFFYFVPYIP